MFMHEEEPFPAVAEVGWTTPDGVTTSKVMRVPMPSKQFAKKYSLIFRFDDLNDVSVLVEPDVPPVYTR